MRILSKNILLTASSKHTYLAQNVRPLEYIGGVVWQSSAYPPQRKEDINEEDSLTGTNLMHYI